MVTCDEEGLRKPREPGGRRPRGRRRRVRGRAVSVARGLAWGGRAVPLQVTGLEFDAAYDCKRVVAPVEEAEESGVDAGTLADYSTPCGDVLTRARDSGVSTASWTSKSWSGTVNSRCSRSTPGFRARLPRPCSWSSGLNIVDALLETATRGGAPPIGRPRSPAAPASTSTFTHTRGVLEVLGEHVMGRRSPARAGVRLLRRLRGTHRLRSRTRAIGRRRSSPTGASVGAARRVVPGCGRR